VLRLLLPVLPVLGPLAVAGAVAALIGGVPRRLRDLAPSLPEDPLDARLDAIAGIRAAGQAPGRAAAWWPFGWPGGRLPGGGSVAGHPLPAGLLLESLGDVLRWGHAGQKARALELAAQPGRPGGALLLRLALRDPDPQVRAGAETLRPQVERRLLEAVEHLRGRGRSAAGRSTQRQLDRELAAPSTVPPCPACSTRHAPVPAAPRPRGCGRPWPSRGPKARMPRPRRRWAATCWRWATCRRRAWRWKPR
jgi:hypothetical protein